MPTGIYPRTLECRLILSLAHKGKKLPIEQRKKMGESRKKYYENHISWNKGKKWTKNRRKAQKHKPKKINRKSNRRLKTKEEKRKAFNEYRKRYRESNPLYRVRESLRTRIWLVLFGGRKTKRTMELIGCDMETFKKYIESQLTEGMNWNNYGKWHIDHIIPCSKFNLLDEKEQVKCFNYKNLQPLWAKDNLRKGNKL